LKALKDNPSFTLTALAEHVGAVVEGDGTVEIHTVAPIDEAGPGALSFVANPKYARFVETTNASALILQPGIECRRVPVLRHPNPYLTFARVIKLIYPDRPLVEPGIHPAAVVASDACIDPAAAIGAFCHVERGARIGKHVQLVSSVYIGEDVVIGEGCLLYPGVRIMRGCRIGQRAIIHSGAVIGSDGFGFAPSETGLEKIKQVGWVEIGDDVEIGSNVTIDRGAMGPTRVGNGTKIDNLVQLGHNVQVGAHCIIVAQVGISGSTRLGDRVVLAGQVGLTGHLELGDGVQVGAQSGVHNSIPAGETWLGSPAREFKTSARIEAAIPRLPDLLKRVRALEKKLTDESGN